MNRTDLENMLNEMDAEDRAAALELDDMMDRFFARQLGKKYGVQVVCNPDGDRTKIMIDGVVMDQDQFDRWAADRAYGRLAYAGDPVDDPTDELPSSLEIPYCELEQADDASVKKHLRNTYNHYLKKGSEPSIEWDDDNNEVIVRNIEWGRHK